MTTGTATSAPSGQAGAQAKQSLGAFRSGTQRTLSADGYSVSTTPGASAQDLPIYNPSPNNYARGFWIQTGCTTSGNSASTAFNGDMPLGIYTVTFQDANEKPIAGPFDTYTLACVNKFGGYQNMGDPRASAVYLATTGSGGTGGSFAHVLYIPVMVLDRDGFGSLQNQSSASTFSVKLTLAASTAIYSTAPTTLAAVTTKIYEDGWWKSSKSGVSTTPPLAGSTQYWTRGTYNALDGAQQQQISQGLGYPIRMIMLMNYDVSDGTRATGDTDFPDPCQLIYKGTSYWNVGKKFWKDQMSRWYGLNSATADTANGLENGVFILPFHMSFTNAPGDELSHAYLGTQQGDLHQLIGNFNGNSKLYAVVNYVAFAPGSAS